MSQPNILMIISDQMTPFLTGAYGHPVVQTPALNSLAENGIRFDAAYTPFPLCSPARACFMTGNAVGAPCVMIRKNNFKYNYMHGYETQLFDLDADPGEWNNLSGQPEHAEIETYLRTRILDSYDLDTIAEANLDSLYRRQLIYQAMQANGTSWAHNPKFDPTKNAQAQYLP